MTRTTPSRVVLERMRQLDTALHQDRLDVVSDEHLLALITALTQAQDQLAALERRVLRVADARAGITVRGVATATGWTLGSTHRAIGRARGEQGQEEPWES